MKLIDQLIAQGNAANAAAGELGEREEANLKKHQAYQALEGLFGQMCADGNLDAGELDRLFKEFKAQGLDTKTLEELKRQIMNGDGTSRVKVTSDLKSSIMEQIQFADAATHSPDAAFQAQLIMGVHSRSWDLASRVSKAEHDMYSNAVKNMLG